MVFRTKPTLETDFRLDILDAQTGFLFYLLDTLPGHHRRSWGRSFVNMYGKKRVVSMILHKMSNAITEPFREMIM